MLTRARCLDRSASGCCPASELASQPMQAHAAGDRREHPANDRRRGWVFVELSLCLVSPAIAVGWTAARDQFATLHAGDAPAHRTLAQLLALDFCGEGLGRYG